ncbi:MAG TPA: dienelactone hydrolase family protein [Caulobacteraceae bacterium]|jgi:predicted dienelactone hydrolase
MKLALAIVGGIVGLMAVLVLAAAAAVYVTALRPARPVGFQQVVAPDPGHKPLAVSLWYPTTARPGFLFLGVSGERVAKNGPVAGVHLPLVVISHGTGGGAASHVDTALALAAAGFVVAAPMHTGDNYADSRAVGTGDWLVDRARQIARVDDYMTGAWKDRDHLDPERVGVFGFSAGATSALIAAGGTPDLGRLAPQCAHQPEFVCKLMKPGLRVPSPDAWTHDPRVKAAVIVAPGFGFAFAPEGLTKVTAPVQLWAAGADQTTVPDTTNAFVVRRLLPAQADFHEVAGAAHYSFLAPCGLISPPQLCKDPRGFDRKAFHDRFNAAVVSFLRAKLAPAGGGQTRGG